MKTFSILKNYLRHHVMDYRLIFLIFTLLNRHACAVLTGFVSMPKAMPPWGVESCEFESSYILSSGTYESLVYWDGESFKPRLAKSWKVTGKKQIDFVFVLSGPPCRKISGNHTNSAAYV